MIEISRGDVRDVARIMPVMETAFDPQFGEQWTAAQCISSLALPNTGIWLAEKDDQICGFALTRWVLDEEELLMIGVDPELRKLKIGSSLIQAISDNANAHDRTKLFLEVRDGNDATLFYGKLGFTQIGRRKAYYKGLKGRKFDAITMQLALV